MRRQWLWVAMVSAGLLTACGGGGGGSGQPATNLNINGVAAKGLMAKAIVTAHAIDANGNVAAAELGRAETDDRGQYRLSFAATRGEPYVIKVTAQAGTKHYDEATRAWQDLPVGFAMRTVFVPTETGTLNTGLNVTPFSEMAVAAAEKVGLTKANVEQARSNLAQMLDFDPVLVPLVDITNTTAVQNASSQSKTMLTMLTAVSTLAHENAAALGCAQTSAGEKTKCVVEAMGRAARINSFELNNGGVNISSHLTTAMQDVVASPTLNVAQVSASDLSSVAAKLNCAATSSCAPAPAAAMPAIDAAKRFLANLRSDLNALFVPGEGATTSAFQLETSRFATAMRDVQAPVEMVGKDLGVLLMGVDLYNDVKAGRSTVLSRGGAGGAFTADDAATFLYGYNTLSCLLTQDANGATAATSRDNANTISCRATYNVDWVQNDVTQQWELREFAHGFTLTPKRDAGGNILAGQFTYTSRARYRPVNYLPALGTVTNAGSSVTMPAGAQPYSGTFNTTTNAAGSVAGFTATGDLPGAFAMNGMTLVSRNHTWNLSGSKTGAANNATNTLSGTVVAKNDDQAGTTQSTLTIRTASLKEIPVARDANGNIVAPSAAATPAGGDIGEAAFNVVWTTPGAEFEGVINASNTAWDKSGTVHSPTALSISGALRNVNGATRTEFFSGSLNLGVSGAAAYDARQNTTDSNFVTVNGTLQGKVTAANRPQLELSLGTTMKSFERAPASATLGYRSLVNGAPTTAVAVSVTRSATGSVVLDLRDLTAGLSLVVPQGASSANLMLNGATKIGELRRNGVMTFADGSFVSLDLGL